LGDERAAESAELGHVELVSRHSPALQSQVERLRAGELNGRALGPKRHWYEALDPC
jgi:hypothetical protein